MTVQADIQQVLVNLETISYVAHRDVLTALPVIQQSGDDITLTWLRAAQTLFEHDREAGKAFIRGSVTVAQACQCVLPWTQQAVRFTAWHGSWKAMTGYMEQLPEACRILGTTGRQRWENIGLDWCERHLDSGIAYFTCPVEGFAGGLGIAGIEEVVLPSTELFEKRHVALSTYLCGAIRVRDMLGVHAVLPWTKRGADILQAGRLRGEAYFRLETEESMALLLENLSGFRLTEHHRLFQLILRAWFASSFDLYDSDWSPDKSRAWVETDGLGLYLPLAMPDRETALLSVLHCAGHLVFDSFEQRNINALFTVVGREHPPMDANQRITWRPLFAAYGEDMLRFQLIFDVCEDTRVDACIANRIPNYLQRLLTAANSITVTDDTAGQHFTWARDVLHWQTQGAPEDERYVQLRELLTSTASIVDAFRIANALYATTTLPAITLAQRQYAILPGRAPNAARPVYPRKALGDAKLGRDVDQTEAVDNSKQPKPDASAITIPQHTAGEDPDMDIPLEDTAGSGGRVGVGIPQPGHVDGRTHGPEYSEKGWPYPEWDYRDNRYKRNWAWVQSKHLTELDGAMAERLLVEHAAALKRLKRAVQSQKPQRMAPKRRQFEGDEIDWDAAVSWVVEKKHGTLPPAAIYRQRRVQTRDTAVTLLADLSTSIMQPCAEGGRVVDRIRASMLLFAESMEAVGDPYSMAGFASKYRDNVSFYAIKSFNERLNNHARALLGGLSGRLATRMGAAIRHAITGFDQAPSSRRLLLILSDGRPADYDDGGDERYLQEDTRMAVKEAIDAGIHPFCITLDAAGSAYLSRIFGAGHYLILDHINDLPKKLPEIYLRLRG